MRTLTQHLAARLLVLDTAPHDDDGIGEVSTTLGIAAVSIVALVAIGAAMQALGLDIVEWARGQLIAG